MEYESKLDKGRVRADSPCPFKERNSVGIPCKMGCPKADVDGKINCSFARLDDNNMREAHDRMIYQAKRIGDFLPV